MAKIGRNDPCPCGSGKKYKKCCLGKAAVKPGAALGFDGRGRPRLVGWNQDRVDLLSTDEIITKLREFGVDFKTEQFEKDVRSHVSVRDLVRHWEDVYPIDLDDFNIDFIFLACRALWERLAPDVISNDKIGDLIADGHSLLEKGHCGKACEKWLQAWEYLKPRLDDNLKSVGDADRFFPEINFISDWCQDLEMELGNAGSDDPSFYEKRIRYCEEFCDLFPESDDLILVNMRVAFAESLFFLGKSEEGEKAFQGAVEDFPESAWTYIGWGDMYWNPFDKRSSKDLKKAEGIYRMGLDKVTEYKGDLLDRLERLEKESQKESSR